MSKLPCVVAAGDDVAAVVAVLGPAGLGVEEVGAQRAVEPRVELAARHRGLGPELEPPVAVQRVLEFLAELGKVGVGLQVGRGWRVAD